jgi:hypothetical protein
MRTFTSYFITIIVLVAMVQPASADGAIALSGGVTLTQTTNPTNMGSQVDAWCGAEIVATWSSTTNKQLKLPEGLLYKAYSQFTGIRNIERIELTPDDGITRWEARQLVGKGWQVIIPLEKLLRLGSRGGSYGGYGLKWKITSRDKENRLMILFIPITWNSSRASEALNQVVVEPKPYNSSLWLKEDWALYMQVHCGFDALHLPDLNFEAQRQALNNYRASQPEIPVERPVSASTPIEESIESLPIPEREPEHKVKTQIDQPYHETIGTEPSMSAPMTIVLLAGSKKYTIKTTLGVVYSGNILVFKRGKSALGTAKVTGCINDTIFATFVGTKSHPVPSFRRGDSIEVKRGGK